MVQFNPLLVSPDEVQRMLCLINETVDPADIDEAVDFLYRLLYSRNEVCSDDGFTPTDGAVSAKPADESLPTLPGREARDVLLPEKDKGET